MTHVVQGIKLVTGEELVATVLHATPDGLITVKDPLLIRVGMGPEGIAVNFFPWTIIAAGEMRIEAHAIVSRFAVPDDVEKHYLQNTSGLQIVSDMPQILKG